MDNPNLSAQSNSLVAITVALKKFSILKNYLNMQIPYTEQDIADKFVDYKIAQFIRTIEFTCCHNKKLHNFISNPPEVCVNQPCVM